MLELDVPHSWPLLFFLSYTPSLSCHLFNVSFAVAILSPILASSSYFSQFAAFSIHCNFFSQYFAFKKVPRPQIRY